jgi:hypothetical protein
MSDLQTTFEQTKFSKLRFSYESNSLTIIFCDFCAIAIQHKPRSLMETGFVRIICISVTQKYQNFDFLGGIVEILFLWGLDKINSKYE